MGKKISIIVPAYNEENNILPLVQRIDMAMKNGKLEYEVIIVDDRSTDKTAERIKQLKNIYPIFYLKKTGPQGKAFSLMEGIAAARHPTIAMIDADLQYPPEKIPLMLDHLEIGWGVVVAERVEKKVNLVRKITGKVFRLLFAKLLHGLDFDAQSGLKVFKKEIIYRINLDPTPWTFDLDFLLQAKNAGYQITSVPVSFNKRHTGESKVNTLKASWEIGTAAIKTKFKPIGIAPLNPMVGEKGGKAASGGFHYKGKKYLHYSTLGFGQTAFLSLTRKQKFHLIFILTVLLLLLLINWHATLVLLFAVIIFIYFVDLLYYLFLIGKSFNNSPEISIKDTELIRDEETLPIYTIFCPLYKEWEVLPQFVEAISAIDYPPEKLQVLLLLEKDDTKTLDHAKNMNLPANFEIVEVPSSRPRTKPKACNYGLLKAKGEYCVIYDAEDVPDPLQLKKVLIAFEKTAGNVECIQAKLNFYNQRQNMLTKLFTKEYSLWFELILTGLQSIDAPIPLGGTSNHFRTDTLRKIGGWDAFNVTEDCDLGMRLARKDLRTAIIDSVTYEEANSQLKNWFNQRTRWVKGYIQTYFVHMRNAGEFTRYNRKDFGNFQLIVGGKVFLMLVNPFMWILSISYFAFRGITGDFIETLFPPVIFYMGVFSMVAGNFIYFYNYMLAAAKRKQFWLIKYAFLVPFYWLLMSAAGWVAVYGLIKNPHYWFKTKHGLHLIRSTQEDKNIGYQIPQTAIAYETSK